MKNRKRQKVKSPLSPSKAKAGGRRGHQPLVNEEDSNATKKINLGASSSKVGKRIATQSQCQLKPENPMKIDVILEVLFSFCPSSTLRNCRLVCKQWKDVSLPSWRNKATLCLNTELCETERKPLTIRDCLFLLTAARAPPRPRARSSSSYPKYLKLLKEFHEKNKPLRLELLKNPFRTYRIDDSIHEYLETDAKVITDNARHLILQDIRSGYHDFGDFMSRLHSLESLEVRNCEWRWETVPGQVIEGNVKRLKVSLYESKTPNVYHGMKPFFQLFPNVEALCVDYRTMEFCLVDIDNIFRTIYSIRHTGQKESLMLIKLKELDITYITVSPPKPLWEEQFEHFFDIIDGCDFTLERLSLNLKFSGKIKIQSVIRSMGQLLHSYSDSLEYLRTCFIFDMDIFIDHVIEDRKLEWWKLKKILKPIRNLKITMDLLKEMKLGNGLWGFYLLAHLKIPNLEKLVVECGKFERKVNILEYQVGLLKDKVYPKLQTFELLDNHQIPGAVTISVFADMMPNLSSLSCPLDKQAFQVVCERFKGLKTLNILRAQCHFSELSWMVITRTGIASNEFHPK